MMPDLPPSAPPSAPPPEFDAATGSLLGAARAQLHKTYIVAETDDGVTIIDQHAAHERLVMERMKAAIAADGVAVQALLLPKLSICPRITDRRSLRKPNFLLALVSKLKVLVKAASLSAGFLPCLAIRMQRS